MKPEEAIEVLSNELIVITDMIGYCKDFEKESDLALAYRVKRQEAHNAAISAIKEVQQYREIGTVEQVRNQKHNLEMAYKIISDYEAIGTVEECREAAEKQKPKKPHRNYKKFSGLWCKCGWYLGQKRCLDIKYCPNCGQAIAENLEGMEDE